MSLIAAILRSLSSKSDIAAVIHNAVDDFNADRLYLNRDPSSAEALFVQSVCKQACRAQFEEGSPTRSIMSRSTYDRVVDALPEVSAEARDSQEIIDEHYTLRSYSIRPYLPSCLFYRRLLVIPVDLILFEVLQILWTFTHGVASQTQSLVSSICAYIPPSVILQFIRTMNRTPSPSLSVDPREEQFREPPLRVQFRHLVPIQSVPIFLTRRNDRNGPLNPSPAHSPSALKHIRIVHLLFLLLVLPPRNISLHRKMLISVMTLTH